MADLIALANPNMKKLEKGMRLRLPEGDAMRAYEAVQTAEGRAGAAARGTGLELLFPDPPPALEEPEVENDPSIQQAVDALLQLQITNPVAFNQLAPAFGLELVEVDHPVAQFRPTAAIEDPPLGGGQVDAIEQPLIQSEEESYEISPEALVHVDRTMQYDLTEWTVIDMTNTGAELAKIVEEQNKLLNPLDQNDYLFTMLGRSYHYFASNRQKDVKIRIKEELGEGIFLCGTDECKWLDYSVPGNIIFGFCMEATFVPEPVYKLGAGFAQTMDDFWKVPYGLLQDSPEDNAAIEFGALLFQKYGTNLTVDDFKRELSSEILSTFQNPPIGFRGPSIPEAKQLISCWVF